MKAHLASSRPLPDRGLLWYHGMQLYLTRRAQLMRCRFLDFVAGRRIGPLRWPGISSPRPSSQLQAIEHLQCRTAVLAYLEPSPEMSSSRRSALSAPPPTVEL